MTSFARDADRVREDPFDAGLVIAAVDAAAEAQHGRLEEQARVKLVKRLAEMSGQVRRRPEDGNDRRVEELRMPVFVTSSIERGDGGGRLAGCALGAPSPTGRGPCPSGNCSCSPTQRPTSDAGAPGELSAGGSRRPGAPCELAGRVWSSVRAPPARALGAASIHGSNGVGS